MFNLADLIKLALPCVKQQKRSAGLGTVASIPEEWETLQNRGDIAIARLSTATFTAEDRQRLQQRGDIAVTALGTVAPIQGENQHLLQRGDIAVAGLAVMFTDQTSAFLEDGFDAELRRDTARLYAPLDEDEANENSL